MSCLFCCCDCLEKGLVVSSVYFETRYSRPKKHFEIILTVIITCTLFSCLQEK